MVKTCAVAILFYMLSGCSALPDWSLFSPVRVTTQSAEPGVYNFAWRLSGDRAVAPAQVFDNGQKMWLQFSPGQTLPAIFEHTAQGDRPLDYQREGPYVVLQKVWPSLILRGGHLKSFIDRIIDEPEPSPALPVADAGQAAALAPATAPSSIFSSAPLSASAPAVLSAKVSDHTGLRQPTAGSSDASVVALASDAKPKLGPAFTASSFALRPTVASTTSATSTSAINFPSDSEPLSGLDPIPQAPSERYDVSPHDHNIRVALSRWARTAGWTFDSEHWAVDADIPIVGSASFESQFKLAVQELVASTELADRPLQPCFYSNKVLRIVPYAQSCDRTANLSEQS